MGVCTNFQFPLTQCPVSICERTIDAQPKGTLGNCYGDQTTRAHYQRYTVFITSKLHGTSSRPKYVRSIATAFSSNEKRQRSFFLCTMDKSNNCLAFHNKMHFTRNIFNSSLKEKLTKNKEWIQELLGCKYMHTKCSVHLRGSNIILVKIFIFDWGVLIKLNVHSKHSFLIIIISNLISFCYFARVQEGPLPESKF